MSSVLVVGGGQINAIKQVLLNHGAEHINHWSGLRSADSHKVIPQDTKMIVLITNWINHSITYKVKRNAVKRGIQVIYVTNGSQALHNRLKNSRTDLTLESDCESAYVLNEHSVELMAHQTFH
jgi:hypothetical protein